MMCMQNVPKLFLPEAILATMLNDDNSLLKIQQGHYVQMPLDYLDTHKHMRHNHP